MNKTDRLNRIFEIVKRENGVPIQTLSDHLGVSHMTVRRDLENLVRENRVKLIHGGVILSPEMSNEAAEYPYSLNSAGQVHTAEKERIGELAASLVSPEDTLIIDSGSTTEFIARSLPGDAPLTVISYALNIISLVASMDNVRSVFAGGTFHANTLMFESPEGRDLITRHRATKAFISAAGVHDEFGVTCSNAYERETKRVSIESAVRKILIADSSKFGVIRSDYFAALADFDEIVTDSHLDEEYTQIARELGITLHLA